MSTGLSIRSPYPTKGAQQTVENSKPSSCINYARRSMLGGMGSLVLASWSLFPDSSSARAPGSNDVGASIQQIQDGALSLKMLLNNWSDYASIDSEGRARSTDGARRILGGIAPQAGAAAIDAAKNTPLYRIDVAFVTVRKAVLEGSNKNDPDTAWRDKFDLERFEELADRVIYGTQKADGNFYSVLFAMKGTTMIADIFVETKKLVQQGIDDLDSMASLLREAGAPGV
ncbi:unnamed protein product [Cylindrotheca closterium]|uniref:Uncharacterized protein n=1 Tax=Cylindrotheca closterium TaxID=2856 RepID=A0AAD2JIW9_9STRA|nr:unnamed protein product [Cylindrotheca closterium]